MAMLLPRIKYTSRDFESLRQFAIETVQSTEGLRDKWTDFNESDIGVALIELPAAMIEELVFMLDMYANEAFLPTARQRRNVVNLCKLIAYKLSAATSAEGVATFKWVPQSGENYAPSSIIIPKYTRLATSGPEVVPFVTIEDVTLPVGGLAIDVRIRQGVLYEEEFESVGVANQQFTLARTDIASNYGSVEVLIGVGDDLSAYSAWHEAANFLIDSPEADQYRFVVDTNHLDQTIIKFGDGRFGAIPTNGFKIVVRYLASRGFDGNVGAGMVNMLGDTLRDGDGIAVTLSVSNSEACIGGADRETIEHAKQQAPQELSSLNRMVTSIDGTALVNGLGGIGKAKVWGEQELPHPDIKHFNHMYVTFIGEGVVPQIDRPDTWLPTTALKDLVLEFAEDKKILTTEIIFIDPVAVFVDVEVDAYISKTASTETVRQLVVDEINDFFAIEKQDFSMGVRFSALMQKLVAIPNVEYVHLMLKRHGTPPASRPLLDPMGSDPDPDPTQWQFAEQDIIARRNEFCQLGDITAADGSNSIIHFERDDEPIRASFTFYPFYQIIGQPITFNGTASASPLGDVTSYEWNFGAKGKLLTRQNDGRYVEATLQPTDKQTVTSNFDGTGNLYQNVVWKYTERPASGFATITLTVRDAFGGVAAYAAPFDVRQS